EKSVALGFERLAYAYGKKLAAVIHLAAYYSFSGEPSKKYDEITIKGTERLLKHLNKFQVDQFIFSSTMLVHAPCQPGERIDENWPLLPKWPYPESKAKTEAIIHQHRKEIPTVTMRISGVYNDWCRSIPLAHQIQRIYERQLIGHVYPGDVSHGQAFLHLEDLVDAIEKCVLLREKLPSDLTLLVGEPDTMTYGNLQQDIARLLFDEEWRTDEIPKPLAKAGAWLQDTLPFGEEPFIKPWMIDLADDHFVLDISKAEQLLDWHPRRRLKSTLPHMIAHLNSDPVRWYRTNHLEAPSWLRQARTA
ncbi:MAG: NAD(P)-dependent oxidoreductase, partial [Cyanobacteria bacterium]|nr:NAD(P)-dependent oxidoreductase [Cyanobacteriota bacterium]